MTSPNRTLITVLLLTSAGAGCMARRTFADRVANPDWPDFKDKVKTYTTLVDKLDKELPALKDKAEAEELAGHRKALADSIRKNRTGAKRGDIFTEDISARLVKIIRSEVRGKGGKPAKETIAEDNPNQPGKRPVTLAVNAIYPDTAPLSTVPPTLLLRLPVLPDTVDYRFVGKGFVLRDTRANIIVDYIPNALM